MLVKMKNLLHKQRNFAVSDTVVMKGMPSDIDHASDKNKDGDWDRKSLVLTAILRFQNEYQYVKRFCSFNRTVHMWFLCEFMIVNEIRCVNGHN